MTYLCATLENTGVLGIRRSGADSVSESRSRFVVWALLQKGLLAKGFAL